MLVEADMVHVCERWVSGNQAFVYICSSEMDYQRNVCTLACNTFTPTYPPSPSHTLRLRTLSTKYVGQTLAIIVMTWGRPNYTRKKSLFL